MNEVTHVLDHLAELGGLGHIHPAGCAFVAADPDLQQEILPHRLAHGLNDAPRKARAVFQRAAVGIRSPVGAG